MLAVHTRLAFILRVQSYESPMREKPLHDDLRAALHNRRSKD